MHECTLCYPQMKLAILIHLKIYIYISAWYIIVLPGSFALVYRKKTLSAKISGELYVTDSSVREFLFFLVLMGWKSCKCTIWPSWQFQKKYLQNIVALFKVLIDCTENVSYV